MNECGVDKVTSKVSVKRKERWNTSIHCLVQESLSEIRKKSFIVDMLSYYRWDVCQSLANDARFSKVLECHVRSVINVPLFSSVGNQVTNHVVGYGVLIPFVLIPVAKEIDGDCWDRIDGWGSNRVQRRRSSCVTESKWDGPWSSSYVNWRCQWEKKKWYSVDRDWVYGILASQEWLHRCVCMILEGFGSHQTERVSSTSPQVQLCSKWLYLIWGRRWK